MKIVAANHADSLSRTGGWASDEAVETVVLDSVRDELRSVYGEADTAVPLSLAALARQLDSAHLGSGDCVA
ncbi:hypothetical protein MKK63_07590 [Methylobacterium sp. J-088]|uniref:hypothetical protein n=1 Tax=unclassified Methylobacterium TaxID=2615210 RepID=UPI001FBAF64C|nr:MULTISPECIES: hypothetical protein [unclassified Methylobacterium]MCJ2062567.1 hypothetical protein [Methylobacterium sp. J-088]